MIKFVYFFVVKISRLFVGQGCEIFRLNRTGELVQSALVKIPIALFNLGRLVIVVNLK
jgi:hypothetical protein